jgi:sugar lactone lactonase YvrE
MSQPRSASAIPTTPATLLLDAKATLGEGAHWCGATRRLYWVDILESQLRWFDPKTGEDRMVDVGEHVGTVVPRAKGGVMLAVRHGFASFDPERGASSLKLVAEPERDKPNNRFNDGKCDPAGRFWAGTLAYDDAKAAGALYRLDADGTVTVIERNISCSNGLVWDLERRSFYYIDTGTRGIAAYDYDHATGAVSGKRFVVRCAPEDGFPDGMALDVEGKLWVAHWGGSQVLRWDPDTGKAIARITLPAPQVTSVSFGGDRLDRLYITSARTGLKPEQLAREPLAGGLFVADPGVRGLPMPAYAG